MSRPALPVRWATAFIGIACLFIVGLQAWIEWDARATQVATTYASLINLASALTQHADGTIDVADAAVLGTVARLRTSGTSPEVIAGIDQTLKAQKAVLSRLRGITVIDSEGNWVATSEQQKGANLSDRIYFQRHRDEPGLGMFISPPVKSVVGGQWVITVSRRFNAADGAFGGVVVAVIDLAYFVGQYSKYDLGPNRLVALLSTDGMSLARYPSKGEFIGQNLSYATLFSELRKHRAGGYLAVAVTDGIRRYTGYRQSDRYPLVVATAMTEPQALGAWRADALRHMLITATLAGAVGLLGLYLIREILRSQAAQAQLRESEERYHVLLQSSVVTEALYLIDPDGKVETWNAGAERIKGYTAAEIIGQSMARFFTPEDVASGEPAHLLDMARDTGRFTTEGWRVRKDGRHFLARNVIDALYRDDRTLRGFANVTHDITEQRIAEEQRAIIIEAAPNGMMIVDEAGTITLVNSQIEQVFDYPRGALIGQPLEILIPDQFRAAHCMLRAKFTSGANVQGMAAGQAFTGRRRDGSSVSIEILLSPVKTPTGRIVVASLFDVTERLRLTTLKNAERDAAETALRESETRLRLVQQVAGIAYSDRDLSQPDVFISEEYVRLYGLPEGQKHIAFDDWFAMVHPADQPRVRAWRNEHNQRGGHDTTDFRICRPDGTVRWVTIRSEVFLGTDGRPRRSIHAQRDITEIVAAREVLDARQRELEQSNADLDRLARDLTEARDRAEQANRAKTRFLAGMSHELRTPLNGILGYAHLLQIEGGLNTAQATRVTAMLAAGKHLLEMITCVLDLSEIEAGHIELQAVACDVRAVAEACLDLIRPAAEVKGLALSIDIASGTPRQLITDPTRLRQILLNLLGNAVKFTTRGSIQLRLLPGADGSVLRIEVADTGAGVPAEQRQRLFRDFERLDNIATRTAEGAGLGLALSAGLARLIGGCLGHDDNPNGGSVFWMELPLKTQAASAPASPHPAAGTDRDPVSLPTRALHVLVVDDVLMNRDIASSFLHAAGHAVTCAEGGAEAVAAAAATDFDVVLMDVRMPEMDGLEATRRIRALPTARGLVPIVALTAHAFTEQVAECRRAGMDSHLSKPFDPETLLAAVAQAVAARSQRPDPSSAPTSSADPAFGSEVPVFDPTAFKRTTAFLAPEAVDSYLRTIVQLGEGLLLGLRDAHALKSDGNALAAKAHTLAGSAGMFGFERLAVAGRRFERAVESDVAEATALADDLCKVIEATHQEIYERAS